MVNQVTPSLLLLFAERGGFEPPVQSYPYAGLANRWFKPLTHLSLVICLIIFFVNFKTNRCLFLHSILFSNALAKVRI